MAEGATIGVGFALAGKHHLLLNIIHIEPELFALGIGAKAVDKVVTPVSKAARIPKST